MDEAQVSEAATETWTEKYRPRKVSEVIGNGESISKFLKWIDSWEKGAPPRRKMALLYGPQGVGKTSLVQALARERHYDLVEMNASDWRSAEKISRVAGRASQSNTLNNQRRIILLDEVDGVSGTRDRGGIPAIIRMQNKSKLPIVLTANDPWNPKFSTLRSRCMMVEFKPVRRREIAALLERISRIEGINADSEALRLLAERAEGDVRAAIVDLQTISEEMKEVSIEEAVSLPTRERKTSVFNTLRGIFKSDSILSAREEARCSEANYEMLFEWIYENIPREYTEVDELCKAMDAISKADIFFNRMRRKRNWRLLPYAIEIMTAGVALSRQRTNRRWTPYQFPSRIKERARWRRSNQMSREIAEKIASKSHCSLASALTEELPYLRVIFSSSVEEAARISRWLKLTGKEIESLSGSPSISKRIHAVL